MFALVAKAVAVTEQLLTFAGPSVLVTPLASNLRRLFVSSDLQIIAHTPGSSPGFTDVHLRS